MKPFIIGTVAALTMACGGVSPECQKMLACNDAAETGLDYTGIFGEGGSCWTNGTAVADDCTDTCNIANSSLKDDYPDITECQ